MKKLLGIVVLGLLWSLNTYAVEKKNLTVVQEIKQLGVFAEPSKYPEGMIEFFGDGCENFSCRADKATKKMASTFKRSKIYHQRNRTIEVDIEQIQDMTQTALFKMPVDIRIDEKLHTIWIEKEQVTFELPADHKPEMVIFNAGMKIPCQVNSVSYTHLTLPTNREV